MSEKVARITDPVATGHECTSTTTISGGSGDVFAEGKGVSRKGDSLTVHTIENGKDEDGNWICIPHSSSITGGSSTVFVNDIAIARVNDGADKGKITGGANSVFSG